MLSEEDLVRKHVFFEKRLVDLCETYKKNKPLVH